MTRLLRSPLALAALGVMAAVLIGATAYLATGGWSRVRFVEYRDGGNGGHAGRRCRRA